MTEVRATRAYIASFGTAGSLVAGAALVFVLASAVVAFRGWPQVAGSPPSQIVVVPQSHVTTGSPASARVTISLGSTAAQGASVTGVTAAGSGGALSITGRFASGVTPSNRFTSGGHSVTTRSGGSGGGGQGGPTSPPAGCTSNCGSSSTPGQIGGTVSNTTNSVGNTVSNTGSTVGSTVTGVANGVANTVGGVSSSAGGVVSGVGKTAGGVVAKTGATVGGVVSGTGHTIGSILGGQAAP